jgi:hypothetical protein
LVEASENSITCENLEKISTQESLFVAQPIGDMPYDKGFSQAKEWIEFSKTQNTYESLFQDRLSKMITNFEETLVKVISKNSPVMKRFKEIHEKFERMKKEDKLKPDHVLVFGIYLSALADIAEGKDYDLGFKVKFDYKDFMKWELSILEDPQEFFQKDKTF